MDSVLLQSFLDFEIIAVNDASTDNSLELLQTFQKKDNRVKVIDLKENKGSGYGRNLAIKKAKGDYIVFLDADDFLMPNALRFAQKNLRKKPKASVLVWGFRMCDKRGVPKREFIPLTPDKKNGRNALPIGTFKKKRFFCVSMDLPHKKIICPSTSTPFYGRYLFSGYSIYHAGTLFCKIGFRHPKSRCKLQKTRWVGDRQQFRKKNIRKVLCP